MALHLNSSLDRVCRSNGIMGWITLIIVILLQCLLITCDEVLRFQLTKEEDVSAINGLAESLSLDFWRFPRVGDLTDVHVDARKKAVLLKKLQQLGVSYDVIIPDVAKLVEDERRSNMAARRRRKRSTKSQRRKDSVVGYYAKHAEIMSWLDKLDKTVPIATVFKIGQSYEGRDLRALKLSTGSNRTAIFISSGMHAREWLAVAAVNYMIEKLIEGYKNNDSEIVGTLSKVDLYFYPIINPDGYEYSFTENRFWRKTRQPWRNCTGTDPNRNFGFHFGGEGTSPNPCSDIYTGPRSFSEPETAALRDFILSIRSKLTAYVDVHCCSLMWLTPWSYTLEPPVDDAELMRVANRASERMNDINNVTYRVGSPPALLYPAAGTSYDWVKGGAGVKYSYTIEVWSNKNRAERSFIAPVFFIKISGEEIYAGIMTMTKEILYPSASASLSSSVSALLLTVTLVMFHRVW